MTAHRTGLRERKKEIIRNRINAETIELIRLHGVVDTSIELICKASDISKKTFYNYYRSRHELIIAICQERLLARVMQMVDYAVSQHDRLDDRLTFFFNVFKQHYRLRDKLERELIRFMIHNFSGNRTEGAEQLGHMIECYTHLYTITGDELRPELSARFCAEITVGTINTLTLNWLTRDDYDIDSGLDQLQHWITDNMLKR
ncbi:MAG: TetR/AcrR family transcriptional regulator [Endozoicomonas sp.]